jgi:pimeloyl-ACP methyl ester carboxylesterase
MKELSSSVSEIQIDASRTMRYLKIGTGDPLILIHTIRTQLEYFEKVTPQLSKHFTVYAIDLPGHGHSSIDTKARYDEPYFRSAVIAFIEKLDLENITLVGESIGAVLSLTVASQLPDRIKKVISSNTYDYDQRYGDGVRRGNFLANFVIGQYGIPYVGAVVARLENKLFLGIIMKGGLKNTSWMPGKLLSEFDRVGRRKGYRYVERSTFAEWKSWGRARSLYSKVKAPVMLVYGQNDWSRVVERERTARDLGGVKITTIENTGHFSALDNAQKLIEIVLAS